VERTLRFAKVEVSIVDSFDAVTKGCEQSGCCLHRPFRLAGQESDERSQSPTPKVKPTTVRIVRIRTRVGNSLKDRVWRRYHRPTIGDYVVGKPKIE